MKIYLSLFRFDFSQLIFISRDFAIGETKVEKEEEKRRRRRARKVMCVCDKLNVDTLKYELSSLLAVLSIDP